MKEVKRQLADREWEDMDFYAQAKDGIVAEIMAHAGAAHSWGCPGAGKHG